MLRLNVSRRLPWVDATGEIRSPLEAFLLLEPLALQDLNAGLGGFSAWEFSVLSDSVARPPYTKLVELSGAERGHRRTWLHSVGDESTEYVEPLKTLWLRFLDWVFTRYGLPRLFVKDLFGPTGARRDMAYAVSSGMLRLGNETLASTTRPAIYTFRPSSPLIAQLVGQWWPTVNGFLGGVILNNGAGADAESAVATSALVSRGQLQHVAAIFETVDSPDNLGFIVLSHDSWDAVERELRQLGFTNGCAVDGLLDRSG